MEAKAARYGCAAGNQLGRLCTTHIYYPFFLHDRDGHQKMSWFISLSRIFLSYPLTTMAPSHLLPSLHLCIVCLCAQQFCGLAARTNRTGSSSGVHGDVGRSSEPEAAEDSPHQRSLEAPSTGSSNGANTASGGRCARGCFSATR